MTDIALPGGQPGDEVLIGRVLDGDVEAYAMLVQRHQRSAVQLAYSFVGNFEDARELSQNGFVKAYRALPTFRGRAKFSTWLYRIIANECKDFFRAKARRPRLVSLTTDAGEESVIFDVEDPSGDPSDAVTRLETARQLQAAIRTLAGKQRGDANRLDHAAGISPAAPGNVERSAVTRTGPHHGQTQRHVDGLVEADQLQRNMSLIMIHGHDAVAPTGNLRRESRVAGQWSHHPDPFLSGAGQRRHDQGLFFFSDGPSFSGMGIKTADAEERMSNTEKLLQGRMGQFDGFQNISWAQGFADGRKRDVAGD